MNILMMTNTYLPHVGGVARSIAQFGKQLEANGHQVMVVAPEFDGMPDAEENVVRIPAIRNFNHTDFSVVRPVPHPLTKALKGFVPDIVHSHHPFLVGNIALRVAHNVECPIVFTHHTKYEDYTHNLHVDNDLIKRFAINLATRYANLCDQVIAPSMSMKEILLERGVTTPVDPVSTGVSQDFFGSDGDFNFRAELGISEDTFVVGHLGRITKEKNIETLANAAIKFLQSTRKTEGSSNRKTCFVLFGDGPEQASIRTLFESAGLSDLFYTGGVLARDQVPSAYRTMDVFLFSSKSETQGMVITEAMASGKPVVAIDAPGVRDVVQDKVNGRLIDQDDAVALAAALQWVMQLSPENYASIRKNALSSAQACTMENSCRKLIGIYTDLANREKKKVRPYAFDGWTKMLHTMETEWQVVTSTIAAAGESLASV